MLDSGIAVADRLISLIKQRHEANRRLFEDHLEPLFLDIAVVHDDYYSSLNELRLVLQESLSDKGKPAPRLATLVSTKRQQLLSLREKARAVTDALQETPRVTAGEEARAFIEAAADYLRIGSGHLPDPPSGGYRSYYADLIEYLSEDRYENPDDPRDSLGYRLLEAIGSLNNRWRVLTQAYARARVALLR